MKKQINFNTRQVNQQLREEKEQIAEIKRKKELGLDTKEEENPNSNMNISFKGLIPFVKSLYMFLFYTTLYLTIYLFDSKKVLAFRSKIIEEKVVWHFGFITSLMMGIKYIFM